MLAYTYISHGKFELIDKPKPELQSPRDAIVRITLGSICTSDLHIKHGSVPRAVPGITVGHEMVGVVEEVGSEVCTVKAGDRVTVNVETFCGECFFCKNGFVNNCTDPNGGWALGCRIGGYYKVEKLYFSTYKDNGIDYPCLKLKLGEHITIGKEWLNIYKIMRPGEIISTNDVLRMYESEKSNL